VAAATPKTTAPRLWRGAEWNVRIAGRSALVEHLVACDGGHSTVRRLVGAPFPGRAGTMSAVTADIDLASAADTVARSATHFHMLQRSGGGYWMMLHPLDGEAGSVDGYRVVFGGGPAHPPGAGSGGLPACLGPRSRVSRSLLWRPRSLSRRR